MKMRDVDNGDADSDEDCEYDENDDDDNVADIFVILWKI